MLSNTDAVTEGNLGDCYPVINGCLKVNMIRANSGSDDRSGRIFSKISLRLLNQAAAGIPYCKAPGVCLPFLLNIK